MKKIILAVICCVMFIGAVSCNDTNFKNDTTLTDIASKIEKETEKIESLAKSQGLEFVSNGDGTCYVGGIGNCTDKNIVFPTVSPNGDIVTSISNHAFCDLDNIETIIISNSITRIGAYAFSECSNLFDVVLADSVVILGQSVFSSCENLESIAMSRNIVNIEDYTFSNCNSLKSITLPRSLYSIGYKAFEQCINLETMIIPNGVNVIEGYAFAGCKKIKNIVIPNSVTDIEGGIFAGCDNLTHISVESENPCYMSIDNCIISGNEIVATCNNFIIPNDTGITSLGKYSISHVSATSITIPRNITNIDFMAITGCSDLKNIFYEGDTDDWKLITKDQHWFMNNADCYVYCEDGIISTAS